MKVQTLGIKKGQFSAFASFFPSHSPLVINISTSNLPLIGVTGSQKQWRCSSVLAEELLRTVPCRHELSGQDFLLNPEMTFIARGI